MCNGVDSSIRWFCFLVLSVCPCMYSICFIFGGVRWRVVRQILIFKIPLRILLEITYARLYKLSVRTRMCDVCWKVLRRVFNLVSHKGLLETSQVYTKSVKVFTWNKIRKLIQNDCSNKNVCWNILRRFFNLVSHNAKGFISQVYTKFEMTARIRMCSKILRRLFNLRVSPNISWLKLKLQTFLH